MIQDPEKYISLEPKIQDRTSFGIVLYALQQAELVITLLQALRRCMAVQAYELPTHPQEA